MVLPILPLRCFSFRIAWCRTTTSQLLLKQNTQSCRAATVVSVHVFACRELLLPDFLWLRWRLGSRLHGHLHRAVVKRAYKRTVRPIDTKKYAQRACCNSRARVHLGFFFDHYSFGGADNAFNSQAGSTKPHHLHHEIHKLRSCYWLPPRWRSGRT